MPGPMVGSSWGDNASASTPTEQVTLSPDLKMNNQDLGKEGQGPLPTPATHHYKVTHTDTLQSGEGKVRAPGPRDGLFFAL